MGAGGHGAAGGAGGEASAVAFDARADGASRTGVAVDLSATENAIDGVWGAAGGASGIGGLPFADATVLPGGAGGSAAAFSGRGVVLADVQGLERDSATALHAGLGGLGNRNGPSPANNGRPGSAELTQLK